jgi:non-heme chloroperoxidase
MQDKSAGKNDDKSGKTGGTESEPASIDSRHALNGGVRIHFLDSRGGDGGTPVVFVPGFGEEAMEHLSFIEALRPRRCIVVDLRGRGRSDVPESGYGMEEHAADLDAVIRETGLKRIHLVSYSRGTTYAMRWATTHPGFVASYSIGDYPAAQIIPPAWFPPKAEKSQWRGRPVAERMPVPAIRRLFADAVALDMWEDLRRLHCPMLVVRGGAQGAMLDEAAGNRYREVVANLTIETFEQSAHDLWNPDPSRFARTVAHFLDGIEARGPAA